MESAMTSCSERVDDEECSTVGLILRIVLGHCPEVALEVRHAPPSRAWLRACQRCRGPGIIFAFFDGLPNTGPTPNSAALASLLRKVELRGSRRIVVGGRVLVVVDDQHPTPSEEASFIYWDRREQGSIPHRVAQHVICQRGGLVGRSASRSEDSALSSLWLLQAKTVYGFARCRGLVHVSLPLATRINAETFKQCTRLAWVSFPQVRELEDHAFNGCSMLETVLLPNVVLIRPRAFYACTKLRQLSSQVTRALAEGNKRVRDYFRDDDFRGFNSLAVSDDDTRPYQDGPYD